jgi:hypothetical protein
VQKEVCRSFVCLRRNKREVIRLQTDLPIFDYLYHEGEYMYMRTHEGAHNMILEGA